MVPKGVWLVQKLMHKDTIPNSFHPTFSLSQVLNMFYITHKRLSLLFLYLARKQVTYIPVLCFTNVLFAYVLLIGIVLKERYVCVCVCVCV